MSFRGAGREVLVTFRTELEVFHRSVCLIKVPHVDTEFTLFSEPGGFYTNVKRGELNLQSLEFKDNHKHDAYRCNLSLCFEARDKMVLTMMLMQKGTKLV